MSPLLSVVIPTRNRQRYAESAVRLLLAITDPDLEVVVQDNSDDRSLAEVLERMAEQDGRLIYHYEPPPLSSVGNFNAALRLATGRYIAVIGDDDLVTPEILDVCRWAEARGVDAVSGYGWRVQYYWPDFRSRDRGDSLSGHLVLRPFTPTVERVDLERELSRCVSMAGVGLQRLPKLYLGIVRADRVFQALRLIDGKQAGTCPDMFYAALLGTLCEEARLVDYPLIVPGASVRSTAGDVAMGQHQGDLTSAPHLRHRNDYVWPAVLPRFYSYETFYAESAYAGLHCSGRVELLHRLNLPLLAAVSWWKHPRYRRAVRDSLASAREARGDSVAAFAAWSIASLTRAAVLYVWKIIVDRGARSTTQSREQHVPDLADTTAAARALSDALAAPRQTLFAAMATA